MACFLAPATTAIITTSLRKKVAPKYHLEWLNTMLWGGVIMLAIEHIAHREVVPYPPFLTAAQNPTDVLVMLQELATIGGAMIIIITLVWVVMIIIANKTAKTRQKRAQLITT